MLVRRLLVCVVALSPCLANAAPDCREVVAQTVQELKAGYPTWSQDMEQLARMAAGAACVKAANSGVTAGAGLQDETVAAAGASSAPEGKSADASGANQDEEENWTPFTGIKFNKVSASPNKKPYERRREVNDIDD